MPKKGVWIVCFIGLMLWLVIFVILFRYNDTHIAKESYILW